MSEMAKTARAAMKDKAKRLTSGDPTTKVDSSTWTPPEPLDTGVKTGMRPISRRAFKSGGKVDGAKAMANMGKSARGGNKPATADSLINRNVKDANEEREGIKHIGGMKKGGAAKAIGGPLVGAKKQMDASVMQSGVPDARFGFGGVRKGQISPARGLGIKTGGKVEKHEDVAEDKALIKKMVKPSARTARKDGGGVFSGPGYPGKVPGVVPGGRTAHAKGGKTGTTVNIIMAGKPADDDMMKGNMEAPTPPPAMPVPVPSPAGMPSGGMPAGMPMPMPTPPAGGAPLARKAGGRTYRSYKDMDAGAGGGFGRLEKTEIQAHKR